MIGIIIFICGRYTTLTWPLSPNYAFDNIIFGEPNYVFGTILLGLVVYFWSHQSQMIQSDQPLVFIANDINQFKYLFYALGAATISLGLSGASEGLFTAPPEEPIVGDINAKAPWLFTFLINFQWVATGLLCIMTPYLMRAFSSGQEKNPYIWVLSGYILLGISFISIGVFTYFTHTGMIVNTSAKEFIEYTVPSKFK